MRRALDRMRAWGRISHAFLLIVTLAMTLLNAPHARASVTPAQPASHASTSRFAAGPPGDPSGWKSIFSDDFLGTSFDTSKWSSCYRWGCTLSPNNELEWYTSDNVIVQNGLVRLRSQRQTVQGSDGKTYNYTSGMLDTTGKFAFIYGYMEARLKVPRGNGLWPAFWMTGVDSWPPEIDAMEILGNDPSTIHMTAHWLDGTNASGDGSQWTGPDFSADEHTIGVDWEPNAITWYIDGIVRKQVTNVPKIPSTRQAVIINLALGGWPGPPDASTVFPNEFDVRYVHVWQHTSNGGGTVPTVVPTLSAQPTVPTHPTAAPQLTATAGPGQVALSWAAVTGAASYNLYRSTTPSGEGATPFKTGLQGTTFTNTTVTAGTTYYYQLTAVNAAGESVKSTEVSGQPIAVATDTTPTTTTPSTTTTPDTANTPVPPIQTTNVSSPPTKTSGSSLGLVAAILIALAALVIGVFVLLRRRQSPPTATDAVNSTNWIDDEPASRRFGLQDERGNPNRSAPIRRDMPSSAPQYNDEQWR